MVARFRQTQARPATDRLEMMRRAMQAMQARRQSAVPTRPGSPVADRVGGMRGAQGAVDFGAAMTGQNTGLQQATDAIRGRVGQGLASKGIYQDQSGYHIQGLPQPPDTGLAMRDAAVAAMGGDPWTKIVQEADARLRAGNPPLPTTAGVNGPVPSPGLGGVPAVSGGTSRTVAPATVSAPTAPAPRGVAPQPGLGGVPAVSTGQPRVATPGSVPGNVTPFPPQGQGVGRTTTPTGNQVSPTQYPQTAPQPGLGGVPSSPGLQTRQLSNGASIIREPSGGGVFTFPDGSQGIIPADGSKPISIPASGATQPYAMQGYASPGAISPSGTGGTQGIDPNASQASRIGMGTGGQVIGAGLSTPPRPTSATVTPPGRVNPQSGVPSPGLGGVPQAAGRPATPTVAPGSVPGQSTPSRPGQMPTTFPNGKPFGTPGPSPIPAMPGGASMPNGAQMAQDIIARVQGVRSQNPVVGQQQTGLAALEGLGNRIRASVMRGTAGTSGMPGVGVSDLGGGLGSDIMGRVRDQLSRGVLGQTPTVGAPAAGQGVVAGGPAPGGPTSAAPAPGPTSGMPTGTGSLGAMGGRYESLDQYNGVFESAGAEFGVPPELLKAMAGVESGWGSVGPDYCRSDGSCGIMQVKGDIWDGTAGCSGQTDVTCNVRTAAKILADAKAQCGNWDCAITGTYFPTDDVQNGTTQGQYLDAVHASMQEQAGNPGTGQAAPAGGVSAAPQINPDLGSVVTGAGSGGVYTPADAGTGGAAVNAPPTDPALHIAAPSSAPSGPTDGNAIISLATQGVGKPYAQGYDEVNGIPSAAVPIDQVQSWDCSGFTRYITHQQGYTAVPVGSEAQYQVAADQNIIQTDLSQIQPGDLVFMDSGWRGGGYCNQGGWGGSGACDGCLNCASHVGIYVGDGKILATNTNGTNTELTLDSYPVLGYAAPGDYSQQDIYPTTTGYAGDY